MLKAENKLNCKQESYLLNALLDASEDAIYFKDTESRFTRVNPFMARMFGCASPDQMVGKTDFDFFTDEHAREAYEDEQRIIKTGEPIHAKVEKETWPDGSITWASSSKMPVRDETGNIVGIVGISRVITERIEAEQEREELMRELVRSNEELEQFAYAVSHDLHEPVRKVKSFGELLQQHSQDSLDEKGLRFLEYLVDGSNRIQEMIEDILSYSRINRKGNSFEDCDLESIVERAKSSLELAIRESNASIVTSPLPSMKVDANQLERCFLNILSNAIKFKSEDSPKIEIWAEEQADNWAFFIRDNGIGIDEKFYKKIFEIFQRLHSRSEYPGSGIGLAITKRIIERHKGEINAVSNEGAGSTFSFTISKHL